MKTLHEVVKLELIKHFPPPDGLSEPQTRVYFRKMDRASRSIIRVIRYFIEFDGGSGNGHG